MPPLYHGGWWPRPRRRTLFCVRLARKFTLAFLIGLCAVLGVDTVSRLRREIEFIESHVRRDHVVMGRTLAMTVAELWRIEGERRAEEVVRLIDEQEIQVSDIHWVWLDAPPGDPHHPKVPAEAIEPVRRGEIVEWHPTSGPLAGWVYTCVPVSAAGQPVT